MIKFYRVHLIEESNEYYTDYRSFQSALGVFRSLVRKPSTIEATVWRVEEGRLTQRIAHCNNAEEAR